MAFGLPFFTHGLGAYEILMVQLLTKKPPGEKMEGDKRIILIKVFWEVARKGSGWNCPRIIPKGKL
jgi:hypothetical protein